MQGHPSGNLVWRDRLLLISTWAVAVFLALVCWAYRSDADSLEAGVSPWLQTAPLLAVVIIPPGVALLGLHHRVKPRLLSAVRAFQQPECYSIVLFAFALGQAAFLFRPASRALTLASVTIVSLMVLWLFYSRTEVDHEALILTGSWSVSLLISRRIVQMFPGTVDPLRASWVMKVFVSYHVFILALLVALPLILLSQASRSTAQAFLRRIAPALPGPFALALAATCLGLTVSQVIGFDDIRLMLVTRASMLALALVAGALVPAIPLGTLPTVRSPDMSKRWYATLLGLICLGYVLLAVRIRSDYINPDGFSYLMIARYYAEGHLVVRGYWSPLISWLIAPAVALGPDPYAAFRVLTQLCGLAWILLTVSLGKRAGLGRLSRLALSVAMALIILTKQSYMVTPDLLSACVMALYFICLTQPRLLERPVCSGILIGLVGAVAYYAKYYNFPFLLVHIPMFGFLLWTQNRRTRPVIRVVASGLATFLLACLPWVLALASRYGYLTISTSGAVNHALIGPGAYGDPCRSARLCDQPEDVLFPGEDPLPEYYRALGWNPFGSPENFGHQIRSIWDNLSRWAGERVFVVGALPAVALITVGLFALAMWKDVGRRLRLGWAFLTVALYAGGYMLTFPVDSRCYLAVVPIMTIAVYFLLEQATRRLLVLWPAAKSVVARGIRALLLAAPILSFAWLAPLLGQLRYQGNPCMQQDSQAIADLLIPPIAGTDPDIHAISYFTRARTYGVVPPRTPAPDANETLSETHVRTFLAAADTDLATALPDLYGYQRVGEARVCNSTYVILRVPDG